MELGPSFCVFFGQFFLCHTVRRYLVSLVANSQNHPGPNFSDKVTGAEYEKHILPTGAGPGRLLTTVGRCAFRRMATFDTIYKHSAIETHTRSAIETHAHSAIETHVVL